MHKQSVTAIHQMNTAIDGLQLMLMNALAPSNRSRQAVISGNELL